MLNESNTEKIVSAMPFNSIILFKLKIHSYIGILLKIGDL